MIKALVVSSRRKESNARDYFMKVQLDILRDTTKKEVKKRGNYKKPRKENK